MKSRKLVIIHTVSFLLLAIWFFSLSGLLNHRVQQDRQYQIYLDQKYTLSKQTSDFYINSYDVPIYQYILFGVSLYFLMYYLESIVKFHVETKK